MPAVRDIQTRIGRLVDGWRTFWFREEPAYTLGLVRIAFGALAICWTLELLPALYDRFGDDGIVPTQPSRRFTWGVFGTFTSDNAILIGWAVLLVASIALMVGWHSRVAALLVFVLILSFVQRNPYMFNAGDTLIRIEALYLALAPCGAALSLDQRRRSGTFWSAQTRRVWPLRLMQIQVTIIYLSTVVAKLAGETWHNGTAVSFAMRIEELRLLPTPAWIAEQPIIANVATWGTIVVELAVAILVWNRRWRPWVLAAGVLMHLWIQITMVVGFFSLAMFVLYLAFVPADRVKAIPDTVKTRSARLVARVRRRRIPRPQKTDLPTTGSGQNQQSTAQVQDDNDGHTDQESTTSSRQSSSAAPSPK